MEECSEKYNSSLLISSIFSILTDMQHHVPFKIYKENGGTMQGVTYTELYDHIGAVITDYKNVSHDFFMVIDYEKSLENVKGQVGVYPWQLERANIMKQYMRREYVSPSTSYCGGHKYPLANVIGGLPYWHNVFLMFQVHGVIIPLSMFKKYTNRYHNIMIYKEKWSTSFPSDVHRCFVPYVRNYSHDFIQTVNECLKNLIPEDCIVGVLKYLDDVTHKNASGVRILNGQKLNDFYKM